ncbi:MAG: magnesium transporter CorA, partial [Gammaproteobacteria bacterium]
MLRVFRLNNQRLEQIQSAEAEELYQDDIWIDIVVNTDEDRALIQRFYNVSLPDAEDLEEIV